jgi:hypothetical protein
MLHARGSTARDCVLHWTSWGSAGRCSPCGRFLASRLAKLVEAGVLERRRYSERPPRDEYLPTEAGAALQPVLLTLMAWGALRLGGRELVS